MANHDVTILPDGNDEDLFFTTDTLDLYKFLKQNNVDVVFSEPLNKLKESSTWAMDVNIAELLVNNRDVLVALIPVIIDFIQKYCRNKKVKISGLRYGSVTIDNIEGDDKTVIDILRRLVENENK